MAEEPVAEGQPVGLVVVVEELVLHLGHVHVGRALGLAPLALETEVHHLVEAPAREVGGGHSAREHRAQGIGPPARRVLLVPGRHVGGAHGALELLAAHAHAVAHLHRGREAALRGEVEHGGGLPGLVLGAVAQVVGDGGAGHDVAGVHQVLGVEGALELAEGLHDHGAEDTLEEGAARAPVPVLAGDGALELEHEVEDLRGHAADLLEAARRLEIDEGPDV